MIHCYNCGHAIRSMKETIEPCNVGFAMFAGCPKCNKRIPVSGLWVRKKVTTEMDFEIDTTRKPRADKGKKRGRKHVNF